MDLIPNEHVCALLFKIRISFRNRSSKSNYCVIIIESCTALRECSYVSKERVTFYLFTAVLKQLLNIILVEWLIKE